MFPQFTCKSNILARALRFGESESGRWLYAVAGKSTEQALVYLLHLALEALDRGGCYLRLFFADFKKTVLTLLITLY